MSGSALPRIPMAPSIPAIGPASVRPEVPAPPGEGRDTDSEGRPAETPGIAGESISVIVPVTRRVYNLAELYAEYAPPLRDLGIPFEFVFVLERGYRDMATPLLNLARRGEPIRTLEMAQSAGEAAILKAAGAGSSATILVTLPPHPRVQPASLPELVRSILDGAELAVARRWPRVDSWLNRVQSRALHGIIRTVLGARVNDVRCGVRALRPRVIEETVIYGDLLLFLPVVAARQGFGVVEVPSPQHPADVGPRFHAPSAYFRRLLDILSLFVLLRFSEKPLRFFGSIGFLSTFAGAVLLAVLFFERIGGAPIANRPLLLLAGLLVVLGVQAIALGLIGEIIVYLNARYLEHRPAYRVLEEPE